MSQILEADEELDLIKRWQDHGDERALDRLCRKFDRTAIRFGNEAANGKPELHDDLVQQARMALVEAARRFDRNRGTRFYTYAVWWIRSYVKEAVREHTAQGKTGLGGRGRTHIWPLLGKISKAGSEVEIEALRQECAQSAGISVDEVIRLELAFSSQDRMDVSGADYDESEVTTVVADDGPSPEHQAIDSIDIERHRRALHTAGKELTGRWRIVFDARYATDEPLPVADISRSMGITESAVRQIEERMRKHLTQRVREILPALTAVPQVDTYAPKPTDEKPVRSRRASQRKLEAMRQDRLAGMTWSAISAKHGYRARAGARLALEGAGMLTDDLIAVNSKTAISAKPQRGRRLAPQVLEQLAQEWRTSRRKKEIAKRYGYSNTTGAWRALKNAGLLDPHPE